MLGSFIADWWRPVLAGGAFVSSMLIGLRGTGPVPPIGPILDPWRGIWAVAQAGDLPEAETFVAPAFSDSVHVRYDDRGVPHIFAATEEDAYRALGFVVARDRLFQLELSVRATEGSLTELVGARALSFDQSQRRLALRWSAERVLRNLDADSGDAKALEAYAEGVNLWIDAMPSRELPIEYRLLGATPRRWEPIHSLVVAKRMGWTLARWNPDLRRLRMQALVGERAARALLPDASPIQEPIQPNGGATPRVDFPLPPPPGRPDRAARSVAAVIAGSHGAGLAGPRPASAMASNNWVVGPSRSASGNALLAGDPHLDLTLPAVWYEAHLVTGDGLDVYGATIAGIPGVIIGFNRDVAWSFTNTGADVLDYYRETLDDAGSPTAYQLDGEWRDLALREERYRDGRGRVIATDTVYFTHRGPLLDDRREPMSVRWTVYDDTTGLSAFLNMAQAASAREFLDALASFEAPAQNAVVADRAGHIAIRSTGRYPIRPGDGDGTTIRDGSRSSSDWVGYWPVSQYPQSFDPAQGYLASANQQPVDPAADPQYLGADWPSPWRAMRINQLLRADGQVTRDAMRAYQVDPGSARADLFVSYFLDAARGSAAAGDDELLSDAVRLLAEWDGRYTRDNERAVLFEAAMTQLRRATWDELAGSGSANEPGEIVLAGLLQHPSSVWWDRIDTQGIREDRDDIFVGSLREALRQTRIDFGPETDGGWRWSLIRQHNIFHLLQFPSFSAQGIPARGGPGTLNPSSGSGQHGASWRMVVELGPVIEACTIYPGGQSGNPMSPRYVDRLLRWAEGQLDCARYPRTPDELDQARTTATVDFVPGVAD